MYDRTFRIRASTAQLERWRAAAKAVDVPLSRYVREAIDDRVAVEDAIRRDEERQRLRARRLHGLDPVEARARDWYRLGPYKGGPES